MPPIITSSPSDIELDMMKYAIVLQLRNHIGLLNKHTLEGYLYWNIIDLAGCHGSSVWPFQSYYDFTEFIQYTERINPGVHFMVLKSPDDVAWFIQEYRIPQSSFRTKLESKFITEKSCIKKVQPNLSSNQFQFIPVTNMRWYDSGRVQSAWRQV